MNSLTRLVLYIARILLEAEWLMESERKNMRSLITEVEQDAHGPVARVVNSAPGHESRFDPIGGKW